MRNLGEVVDRLLVVIPESEVKVRNEIVAFMRHHAAYNPPEMMREHWGYLSLILEMNLGPPESCEWTMKVKKIMAGEE